MEDQIFLSFAHAIKNVFFETLCRNVKYLDIHAKGTIILSRIHSERYINYIFFFNILIYFYIISTYTPRS
jgi:hypothetical protein